MSLNKSWIFQNGNFISQDFIFEVAILSFFQNITALGMTLTYQIVMQRISYILCVSVLLVLVRTHNLYVFKMLLQEGCIVIVGYGAKKFVIRVEAILLLISSILLSGRNLFVRVRATFKLHRLEECRLPHLGSFHAPPLPLSTSFWQTLSTLSCPQVRQSNQGAKRWLPKGEGRNWGKIQGKILKEELNF